MIRKRLLIHAAFLFLLPLIVAWFGLSFPTTLGLVILALLWRWLISLTAFSHPEETPDLILDTITMSHFVEKTRWNMDVAGFDYTENPAGGTLGAFFAARTVPRLRLRTGLVQSSIGNSAEILRYLWGAYGVSLGDRAAHLEPTQERLEFERRLDRYGVSLQVWVYYHILDYPELTLRSWGMDNPAVPGWQRKLLAPLFPVLRFLIRRAFRVSEKNFKKACHNIEAMLEEVDTALSDGRGSILGDGARNFTDYAFAAFSGLWLQPEGYGGAIAATDNLSRDRMPDAMRKNVENWEQDYPRVVAFVEKLYAEERTPPTEGGDDAA
jgi:uncharacterized protein Usg